MTRAAASTARPRLAALYATRRWLLLLLLTVAWLLAALVGLTQLANLSAAERACLILGAACLIIAWIFQRNTWALIVLVAAPSSLVVAAWLSPPNTDLKWIALSSSLSQVAFGVVLLCPRWVGLAGIGAAVAALGAIWAERPANVIPGALVIADGWIALAAIAASTTALWLAWHRLLKQALVVDRRLERWEHITDTAREQQERARLWRDAVAQVHETLLTTIRYVLQASVVDPNGLVSWRSLQEALPRTQVDWRESVAQATAARIGAGIVQMDESLADLPIQGEVREPIRAAVFEGVCNAVRHGGASRVTVTGGVDDDSIWILVQDNGSGPPADWQPGIGWSSVLNTQLTSIGGSWSIAHDVQGTDLTIRVPVTPSVDRLRGNDDGFEQGRILMTWPLLALSMVSVVYSGFLPLLSFGRLITGSILAIGIALGIVSIVRMRPWATTVRPVLMLGIALIPTLILLLEGADPILLAQTSLIQASALAALLQATGYTVIVLGLWSRLRVTVVALSIWGCGAILLALAVPGPLRTPVLVALANCLIVMPIVGGVSRIGTRRFAAAQRIVQEERSRIVLEAARAEVSRSINASLESCVGETNAIIDEIAATGDVNQEQRARLALLDGLIRATIQVDPVLNGGFAQVGSELVVRGFQAGTSFDVRVINASQDMRAINRGFLDCLAEIVATCDLEGRLQVFHDDVEDFLVLTLRWSHAKDIPSGALAQLRAWAAGGSLDTTEEDQGLVVDVDWVSNGDPAELTVTVSRRIQVPAEV